MGQVSKINYEEYSKSAQTDETEVVNKKSNSEE